MMIVSSDQMETSSVIPVIGGSGGAVAGSIKNVMEDDPSILQVKQEDIAVQESPFLRIMGWFHTPSLLFHTVLDMVLLFYHILPYIN